MGKIVVSTNVSLDGVVEDPDGAEGFKLGGWFGQFGGKDLEVWSRSMTDEALQAAALLLGRKTDAWFAARWLDRTGPWADRLNTLPKYVVSSTIKKAAWSNATVLKGDVADAVSSLKRDLDGDILVYASYQLVRSLIQSGLVDEFRLTVFPVVLGSGERLFGDSADAAGSAHPVALRLVDTQTLGAGLEMLTYGVVRDA